MVVKTKPVVKIEGAALFSGPSTGKVVRKANFTLKRDHFAAVPKPSENRSSRLQVDLETEEEVDVIDLGAPRRLRRAPPDALPGLRAPRVSRIYTPNPRLYPGPTAAKPKRKRRRSSGRAACRRVFRRPVPNARLYRPAPRRLPPPAAAPRGPWPPPAPLGPRAHDTASRAALHLAARRYHLPSDVAPSASPQRAPPAPSPSARRLVVTLPQTAAGMDAAARHSASDDCSDGDALSAPSEFLAEFLSAIMQRQYVEALKYCRLILQYEPHNATARGFHPLLQHKVQALKRNEACAEGAAGGASSSDSSAGSPAQRSPLSLSNSHSRSLSHGRRGRHQDASPSLTRARGRSRPSARSASRSGSESGGSVASQSSLEMDSSSASPSASASASASARSDTGSGTRTRSDNDESDARDDNGNPPPTLPNSDDVENDNEIPQIKSESSSSLRRLRAQFACSIK